MLFSVTDFSKAIATTNIWKQIPNNHQNSKNNPKSSFDAFNSMLTFQGVGDVSSNEGTSWFVYGSELYKSTGNAGSFRQV